MTIKKAETDTTSRATPPPRGASRDDGLMSYLNQVGTVELLSRESEVDLATRIEAGELRILRALSSVPFTRRFLVDLGGELRRGDMALRKVVREATDASRLRPTLTRFDRLARLALAHAGDVVDDVDAVLDFEHHAPAARIAHPRTEHFAPLFVSLGATADTWSDAHSTVDGFWYGMAKRSFEMN